MYEQHWRLNKRPFESWGDEAFYYPSEIHQTASWKLRYALDSRRAVMVVAGDSGTGKSLLIERLLRQLPEPLSPAVRLAFPQLSGEQLVGYLTDKVTGIPGPPDEPPRLTLARLERFLQDNVEASRHAVVVIDEAHLLGAGDQLETLRLLLNLADPATGAEASWSLVLVGQTTLMNVIERNRAFDERVAVKCLLHRFTPEQTAAYLHHRIQAGGGQAEQIFTSDAIDALHVRSAGIPRRIDRLADLALMVGFAEELSQVGVEQIDGVHQELVGTT